MSTVSELQELIKTKYRDYELKGEYEHSTKQLHFMRWPFATSAEVMPKAIEILGSVFSAIISPTDGKTDLVSLLASPTISSALATHFESVGYIITKSLMLRKENGFKSEQDAYKFVRELEMIDIIGICYLLYEHNLEALLKNLTSGTTK